MSKKETKDINNKKQNLSFMLLVILLISVILCISSFGIATWARYRSVTGSNVEAQIAKWSFKVNGEEEQFADIDLADTIDFTHVTTDKIAPGTYGSFDLDIDARGSEVSLDYYINISVNEKPTNLKFYSDSGYTTPITISADNKIYLDGEFLISNSPMQEVRTIYWKWDYRTESLPSTSVLQGYYSSIEGLETLVSEYDSATVQQKQELALKINDKIDTYEAGGNVLLEVSVKGVQINPSFSLKRVQITSGKDQTYDVGDSVNLSLEFTENVYADNINTAIDGTTAPEVTLAFGGASANNPVAKVASLMNTNLRLSTGENVATFVSVNGNKINYTYTIKSTDIGVLRIANITGSVYNSAGKQINFGTVQAPTIPEVIGGTVSAQIELIPTPTGTSVTPGPVVTVLTSAQLGDYVDIGTNILDLQNITLSDNSHPTTDWRVFNKDENGTWLMLADCLPKSSLPSGTGLITNPDNNYPYSIYASSRSYVLDGLNSDGWNDLLDNTLLEDIDGVVVKGGTSIETWVESYNLYLYNTQLTVINYGDERKVFGGYSNAERTISNNVNDFPCYLDLNSTLNTLFFPHIDNHNCYIINTPFYANGNHKCVFNVVYDDGGLNGIDCNNNQWSEYERWGLRPVVYIPNSVQFSSQGNVYTVVENN